MLDIHRGYLNIGPVLYYALRDDPPEPLESSNPNLWNWHTGLQYENGSEKMAYDTMMAAIQARTQQSAAQVPLPPVRYAPTACSQAESPARAMGWSHDGTNSTFGLNCRVGPG